MREETSGVGGPKNKRLVQVCVFLGLFIFALHHVLAVFTEAINWDEFALFQRAQDLNATGVFRPGGRPGLALLLLAPLVSGCSNAMDSAQTGRVVWLLFGLGYPVALYLVIREFLRAIPYAASHCRYDAFAGVLLLVFVPVWTRWSLHVRTDQPALFFSLLGGLLLIKSRDRIWLAFLSGGLICIAFLFSQKAVYSTALIGVLVVAHSLLEGRLRVRRQLVRVGLAALGGAIVLASFSWYVAANFEQPDNFTLSKGVNTLSYYRSVLGWGLYKKLAWSSPVHIALLAILPLTTLRAWSAQRVLLLCSWALLGLGLAVGWFHGAGFAYFWMTIGLFPAAGLALSLPALRSLLRRLSGTPRLPASLAAVAVATLVGLVAPSMDSVLTNTQTRQRAMLDYVDKNFSQSAKGFHSESALYCREESAGFRTYFSIHIRRKLKGPENRQAREDFIEQFKTAPVAFIVPSFRLSQYPSEIIQFWFEHYIFYGPGVMVPGFRVQPGKTQNDVIVPGMYRWLPQGTAVEALVGGRVVRAGDRIELRAEPVNLSSSGRGLLIYDVQGGPVQAVPFYSVESVLELDSRI